MIPAEARVRIRSAVGAFCVACALSADANGPDLHRADRLAWRAFPDGLGAIAASHLPADDTGLIGRNRAWGAMHSARFQLGAGRALRIALAAGRIDAARRAFRAVEAGTDTVAPDGRVPGSLPPEVDGPPSRADLASAAAFFLGDACLGLTALEASEAPERVASSARRASARAAVARAAVRLLEEVEVLADVDARAPNRLLLDARAFRACAPGIADGDDRAAALDAADAFVLAALELLAGDGHFVEGGGHDTSYQGVALAAGEEVLLAGRREGDVRLARGLDAAARWLAARIGPDGAIDSSGNARTCGGGERVFGTPKRVSVPEVFTGLALAGSRLGDPAVLDAARRVERRALAGEASGGACDAPAASGRGATGGTDAGPSPSAADRDDGGR